MIPASYLFKTVFDDAWTTDAPTPALRTRPHHRGLLTPILSVLHGLSRPARPGIRPFGVHAYD